MLVVKSPQTAPIDDYIQTPQHLTNKQVTTMEEMSVIPLTLGTRRKLFDEVSSPSINLSPCLHCFFSSKVFCSKLFFFLWEGVAGGSSAQADFADQETAAGLHLSGHSPKTSLTLLNLPGVCTPVSTALEIIEPHKLLDQKNKPCRTPESQLQWLEKLNHGGEKETTVTFKS